MEKGSGPLSGIFMWGNNQGYEKDVVLIFFSRRGSILILVLWILVLLSFLAGDYLAHNREKAVVSSNAWNSEKENQAINSVIQLFSTNVSPLSGQEEEKEWINLSPGGVNLWVKMESEGERTNLNSASDSIIREKIRDIMGDERGQEADQLTDAILDWRDVDNLTRMNGAEAGYYQGHGLSYVPGNGPFQSLTELLLVKGMSSALFWGDPLASIRQNAEKKEEEEPKPSSFVENLTIYGGNVKRVSIVIPGRGSSYLFILAFLGKINGRWRTFQVYRTMLLISSEESLSFRN